MLTVMFLLNGRSKEKVDYKKNALLFKIKPLKYKKEHTLAILMFAHALPSRLSFQLNIRRGYQPKEVKFVNF